MSRELKYPEGAPSLWFDDPDKLIYLVRQYAKTGKRVSSPKHKQWCLNRICEVMDVDQLDLDKLRQEEKTIRKQIERIIGEDPFPPRQR